MRFRLIMFTFLAESPFLNFHKVNGEQTQLETIPVRSFPYLLISDNTYFKAYSWGKLL